MMYQDRTEAGRRLAELVARGVSGRVVVLALPRGGVVVGYQIARRLPAPLEVIVARKLGAPGQEEFGFGAIAPDGVRVIDQASVRMLGITHQQVEAIVARETAEMQRREALYRRGRDRLSVRGATAILVDDGVATGVTARAAIRAIRLWAPDWVVMAVPVAPPDTARTLAHEVDEFICQQWK